MALFDQNDFTGRLLRLFPTGWLPSIAPRINAVLQAPALALSLVYQLLVFVKAQQRVSSAGGAFLDLAASDYFGDDLPRLQFEQDAAYATRVRYNLTAPRGTWDGMTEMLEQLTGNTPTIWQPNLPSCCSCMGSLAEPSAGGNHGMAVSTSLQAPFAGFGGGGNVIGTLGTLRLPCQVFIIVAPPVTGYAVYTNYDCLGSFSSPLVGGAGGLGSRANPSAGGGDVVLANPDSLSGEVTNALIYRQIADWMPVGYLAWVLISNQRLY